MLEPRPRHHAEGGSRLPRHTEGDQKEKKPKFSIKEGTLGSDNHPDVVHAFRKEARTKGETITTSVDAPEMPKHIEEIHAALKEDAGAESTIPSLEEMSKEEIPQDVQDAVDAAFGKNKPE